MDRNSSSQSQPSGAPKSAATDAEPSAAFTSGPWQSRDDYDGQWTIIGNVDGEYFTDSAAPVMSYEHVATLEDEYGETHERTAANRRLLLAAPDLLAALKALLPEGWGDDDTMDHMPGVKLARAAITKALGLSAKDTSDANDKGPGRTHPSPQPKGDPERGDAPGKGQ